MPPLILPPSLYKNFKALQSIPHVEDFRFVEKRNHVGNIHRRVAVTTRDTFYLASPKGDIKRVIPVELIEEIFCDARLGLVALRIPELYDLVFFEDRSFERQREQRQSSTGREHRRTSSAASGSRARPVTSRFGSPPSSPTGSSRRNRRSLSSPTARINDENKGRILCFGNPEIINDDGTVKSSGGAGMPGLAPLTSLVADSPETVEEGVGLLMEDGQYQTEQDNKGNRLTQQRRRERERVLLARQQGVGGGSGFFDGIQSAVGISNSGEQGDHRRPRLRRVLSHELSRSETDTQVPGSPTRQTTVGEGWSSSGEDEEDDEFLYSQPSGVNLPDEALGDNEVIDVLDTEKYPMMAGLLYLLVQVRQRETRSPGWVPPHEVGMHPRQDTATVRLTSIADYAGKPAPTFVLKRPATLPPKHESSTGTMAVYRRISRESEKPAAEERSLLPQTDTLQQPNTDSESYSPKDNGQAPLRGRHIDASNILGQMKSSENKHGVLEGVVLDQHHGYFSDPSNLAVIEQGGSLFSFTCRPKLLPEEESFVAQVVNLSSFKDEWEENAVPHFDISNPKDVAKYTFILQKCAYILPEVDLEALTPELLSSYEFQKNCQPKSTKVWKESPPSVFRITKQIVRFIYSMTIQFKVSEVPQSALPGLSNLMGIIIHKGLLLERTKRHKGKADATAKAKSLLLYTKVHRGVLVINCTVGLNTFIPDVVARIINNFGSQGLKEVCETAARTRAYLHENFPQVVASPLVVRRVNSRVDWDSPLPSRLQSTDLQEEEDAPHGDGMGAEASEEENRPEPFAATEEEMLLSPTRLQSTGEWPVIPSDLLLPPASYPASPVRWMKAETFDVESFAHNGEEEALLIDDNESISSEIGQCFLPTGAGREFEDELKDEGHRQASVEEPYSGVDLPIRATESASSPRPLYARTEPPAVSRPSEELSHQPAVLVEMKSLRDGATMTEEGRHQEIRQQHDAAFKPRFGAQRRPSREPEETIAGVSKKISWGKKKHPPPPSHPPRRNHEPLAAPAWPRSLLVLEEEEPILWEEMPAGPRASANETADHMSRPLAPSHQGNERPNPVVLSTGSGPSSIPTGNHQEPQQRPMPSHPHYYDYLPPQGKEVQRGVGVGGTTTTTTVSVAETIQKRYLYTAEQPVRSFVAPQHNTQVDVEQQSSRPPVRSEQRSFNYPLTRGLASIQPARHHQATPPPMGLSGGPPTAAPTPAASSSWREHVSQVRREHEREWFSPAPTAPPTAPSALELQRDVERRRSAGHSARQHWAASTGTGSLYAFEDDSSGAASPSGRQRMQEYHHSLKALVELRSRSQTPQLSMQEAMHWEVEYEVLLEKHRALLDRLPAEIREQALAEQEQMNHQHRQQHAPRGHVGPFDAQQPAASGSRPPMGKERPLPL